VETVEIIAVGDEILRGEVRELNTSFLSLAMARIGLAPSRVTVLPDDIELLEGEIGKAVKRSTIVVVTGGLGPTVDDVTKEAAIRALGGTVELRDDVVEMVEARFSELGREMPEAYRAQARVPAGAVILPNTVGAAVGLGISRSDFDLFLLPGVPEEMRAIFTRSVLPAISGRGTGKMHRLRTFGLTETELEGRLRMVPGIDLHRLSIISNPGGVDLYMPADLIGAAGAIRAELGSYCFATGDAHMEEVVIALLAERRETLATAESVTGGLLASTLISVPGASEVLIEGVVAYSNESKTARLSVDARLISNHGAVSREVCAAMAHGVRVRSRADFALSTTGIAGPGGGSDEKPVGLCYVGLATAEAMYCRRYRFPGTRDMVRLRAVYRALDLARLRLIGDDDRMRTCRMEGA
jgi:nicotinamide-nucleotide amidase